MSSEPIEIFYFKQISEGLSSLNQIHDNIKSKFWYKVDEEYFKNLKKIDEKMTLSDKHQYPPQIDPKLVEKVKAKLNRIAELELTRREIKLLCWSPEVSCEQSFFSYIKLYCMKKQIEIPSQWLIGLISSYHSNYGKIQSQMSFENIILSWLNSYKGKNRVLEIYKQHSPELIGDTAAHKLGERIQKENLKPKTICEELKIAENSNYLRKTLCEAIQCEIEAQFSDRGIDFILNLLNNQYLTKKNVKEMTAKLILHNKIAHNLEFQHQLINFILGSERLGDPRRPQNCPNWIGIEEGKNKFIQWLSKEDIEWFFNVILERNDPHGRKQFWLQYIKEIEASRVVLSMEDSSKLSLPGVKVVKGRDYANFQSSSQNQTSAFILVFPQVVAVEFSRTSNACYLYRSSKFKELVPDLWKESFSSPEALKSKYYVSEKISHQSNWQDKMKTKLAEFGVR